MWYVKKICLEGRWIYGLVFRIVLLDININLRFIFKGGIKGVKGILEKERKREREWKENKRLFWYEY